MKIYAPVKNTNGVYASVRFVNGVGETDNPHLIKWFETHGYTVEKCVETHESSPEKCNESQRVEGAATAHDGDVGNADQPDFDSMTPIELREWMRENGYGSKIKNTRNKEKLLEILRG